MARRVGGPYVSGRLTNKQQGAAISGATITVNQTVYTDDEMQNPTTTVVTNGTGDFSFYALPGIYTFATAVRDAAPIEPVEILGSEGLGADRGVGTFVKVNEAPLNVLRYGATGDGSTDDTTALQAAVNAVPATAGGSVYVPTGVYMAHGLLFHAQQMKLIMAPGAVIKKNANGTLITLDGAGWSFDQHWDDPHLDGNGAVYTGRIVDCQGGGRWHVNGGIIENSAAENINFAADAGSVSKFTGVTFGVYLGQHGQTNAAVPCINLPHDTGAPNRAWVNCGFSGCLIAADAGSQDTKFEGCDGRNFNITGAPAKFMLIGSRIASVGEEVALAGTQNVVVANAFAGTLRITGGATTANGVYSLNVTAADMIFDAGTTGNSYVGNRPVSGTLTDNGTNLNH